MKILVIFDSLYGNTEQIARAIAGAVTRSDEARVVKVDQAKLSEMESTDLLFIGSPTQGGRATKPMQEFLEKITADAIKGIKVAAFDTRISTKIVGIFGYAAGRIARDLKGKGSTLVVSPEGFFVKGTRGPLKEGEIERAAAWAKGILESK